ncbi:SAM-dependent methyltransferase [Streptomyces sp. SBT349]|uniref:SAM-dependent methyltransferase n=1 Tax=Streptomyces sp. SBT349 TaxID=1580539 RepID=UPI00066D6B3C|nr:SAM-dependent methyltransferase [Streptomyces sp. SBT349]
MDIDSSTAHAARVWNFWLGGTEWYGADKEAGEQITRTCPGIVRTARCQRMFLARAVRFLAGEAGIHQFLDLGSGLPTVDNTHEVAQRVAPECRVVYVDNDPLVLAHARALLTSTPRGRTAYIDADVRAPEDILEQVARILDFTEPVAVTMLGILGHIPDEDRPGDIVRRVLDPLPRGSHLAVSDGTDTSATLNAATTGYNARLAGGYTLRRPEEVAGFFEGLALLPPGVVTVDRWRPKSPPPGVERPVDAVCGLAVKP